MKTDNYFYSNIEENKENKFLLQELNKLANKQKQQIYVIKAPLSDQNYSYDDTHMIIILSSKRKIAFVTSENSNEEDFHYSKQDVIEDIASISDKYDYRSVIGRPRKWTDLILSFRFTDIKNTENWFNKELEIKDKSRFRVLDLLISLFIGSINDIKNISAIEPESLLDKVKQKIQLFDGQQTRFIYEELEAGSKRITVQGLSGTGKTELLLHKLRDLYVHNPKAKFCFTCYNKILANSMKTRIPEFFDFMKVDQQIDWDRLMCVNAWGGFSDIKSGVYRYVCFYYGIPFYSYRESHSFDLVCKDAIKKIKQAQSNEFAFTYMFIDESQDFDESFFELCELVTEKKVFIAGDIFQTIFEERKKNAIQPNFLLSKCYRTDPKTLMFAQAIGMGLFEKQKLWWLDKDQWEQCGYNVNISGHVYTLTREPLRRFEDLDPDFDSLKIYTVENLVNGVVSVIKKLQLEFPTITSGDIAIIFLDNDDYIYDSTQDLVKAIGRTFNYECDVAYETKKQDKTKVLISNKYNVKGLEYPFVICYTAKITKNPSYRNTVYTMLTRSFLRSYLLLPNTKNNGMTDEIIEGGKKIMKDKQIVVTEPTEEEKKEIKTWVKLEKKAYSLEEKISMILEELDVTDEDIISKVKQSCNNLPAKVDNLKLKSIISQFVSAFQE